MGKLVVSNNEETLQAAEETLKMLAEGGRVDAAKAIANGVASNKTRKKTLLDAINEIAEYA
jgi:hypothetical protein